MTGFFVDTTIEKTAVGTPAYVLAGSGDTLFVASSGSLVALGADSDGIDLNAAHEAVTLDGVAYSANNFGIYAGGSYATIHVNGEVDGLDGIVLDAAHDEAQIGAKGDVFGTNDGIVLSSSPLSLSNDGHIEGNQAGVYVYRAGDDIVSNEGTISSSTYGVDFRYDVSSTIHNGGLISGATDAFSISDSVVTIDNSGTIHGNLMVYDATTASTVNVDNSGVWHASSLSFGHGTDTLTNSGTITAGIYFVGTDDTLTNSGAIHGNVSMGVGDVVSNTGAIHGNVTFISGNNIFEGSHGDVTGTITGGTGADTITGSIHDANTIFGGNAHDVLTGGNADDVLNGGAGNDVLTGGRGDDILTGGGGADLFKFSGNFGNDTITDFVAGSGSTHSVINFAHNDFGSFSGVQAHMAQVGSDVVITFDATDSIVLQHVTLANLVSADFTFG